MLTASRYSAELLCSHHHHHRIFNFSELTCRSSQYFSKVIVLNIHSTMSSRKSPHRQTKSSQGQESNSLLTNSDNGNYITFASGPDANHKEPSPATTQLRNTKSYLNADLDTRWTDLILIACFGTSGLIDSGAYNAYNCFTSMMVRIFVTISFCRYS